MTDINEDRILASLLKAGNSYAFDKLYYKYSKKLYNFALKILRNKEDAEGIVQHAFMKIWENRCQIDCDLLFSAYLFRISRNLLYNQLKKKLHEKVYLDYLLRLHEDGSPVVEEEISFLELSLEINRLIDELPAKRREIFILSRYEGLTYKQIAGRLNISVNTVNTQISKSLEQIRDQLVRKFHPIRK